MYGHMSLSCSKVKRGVLVRVFTDYNGDRMHPTLGYVTPNEFVCNMEGEGYK